jgi:hypothetical protein
MVYSNTTTKAGIIQAEESYCELGDAGISGNTTLLREFARHNNTVMSKIWSWIFQATCGSIYDDSNQTNLPQATQNLTAGTFKYALPTDTLIVDGIEIQNSSGNWSKLTPVNIDEVQRDGTLGDFGRNSGTPTKYRWTGNTIILNNIPTETVANGFKVYFTRGSVEFAYDATSATPGFVSEFHNAVAVGGSMEWLKVHKPDSLVFKALQIDWANYEDSIKKFYSLRYKDFMPFRIRPSVEDNR